MVPTPEIWSSLVTHDHCLGGRLCCEDTQDTHGDVVRLEERPQDKASVDTCHMHAAQGCRRSPPTHSPPPGPPSPACSLLWPSAASGHPHGGSFPPVWAMEAGSRGGSESE